MMGAAARFRATSLGLVATALCACGAAESTRIVSEPVATGDVSFSYGPAFVILLSPGCDWPVRVLSKVYRTEEDHAIVPEVRSVHEVLIRRGEAHEYAVSTDLTAAQLTDEASPLGVLDGYEIMLWSWAIEAVALEEVRPLMPGEPEVGTARACRFERPTACRLLAREMRKDDEWVQLCIHEGRVIPAPAGAVAERVP